MRKSLIVCLSVCLLIAGFTSARAQSTARVELYDLHDGDFPQMEAGLDVFDSAGNFVTDLDPAAIRLLENESPLPVNGLEAVSPGVMFALALDPGPYFAYRDINAVTRYDKIYNLLQEWAATHSDELGDDLSFVPNEDVIAPHLTDSAAFAEALQAYSPPLATIKPNLDTLSRALDAVSDQAPQVGMKATVLYIASPPTIDAIPELQNLTQRAVAEHIRVNVWIVVSADAFGTSGATALKDLAIQTGGQYVLYSGQEPLPGPELYLAPLRHSYRIRYTSAVLTGGTQTLERAGGPERRDAHVHGGAIHHRYPAAQPHAGLSARSDRPAVAG